MKNPVFDLLSRLVSRGKQKRRERARRKVEASIAARQRAIATIGAFVFSERIRRLVELEVLRRMTEANSEE